MKKFIIKETQLEKLLELANKLRPNGTYVGIDGVQNMHDVADDIDDLLFEIEHLQEANIIKRSLRNNGENLMFSSFR